VTRVIDLSHPLAPGMPVYPGTAPVAVEATATVADRGYREHRVSLSTHTGTHVDAPAHMLAEGRSLDTYPAETFVGPATVLDVAAAPGGDVDRSLLDPHAELLARQAFLLLRTGWSAHWGESAYFEGFPALTPAAAAWLAELGLRGIGVDSVSIDRHDSSDYAVHRTLMARELLIIENLRGLEELVGREFTLACLPLALVGADGATARAVALID
jgi:kynurenine formamidase